MLVVLACATLWGIWKGMAWQIASLASIVLSAAVAIHGSAAAAPLFGVQEPWNRYLAMLVLYIVTAAAIWIVFHLISRIMDRVKLKDFDRQLGAIFGLAKGVLYCVVITFFAMTLSDDTSPIRPMVLQSRSGDLIARGIRNANPILPAEIRTHLGKYIDELDAKLHPAPTTGAPAPTAAQPAAPATSAPPTAPPPSPAPAQNVAPPAKKKLRDYLPKLN